MNYTAHSKLGLAGFYLRRAAKHLESMTDEEIDESAYFVKNVLPNVISQCKKYAEWCTIAQNRAVWDDKQNHIDDALEADRQYVSQLQDFDREE